MFDIILILNEINRTDRETITRRICGSNFLMENGEYAETEADRLAHIQYWIEERGVDQNNSPLELISYTVEAVG